MMLPNSKQLLQHGFSCSTPVSHTLLTHTNTPSLWTCLSSYHCNQIANVGSWFHIVGGHFPVLSILFRLLMQLDTSSKQLVDCYGCWVISTLLNISWQTQTNNQLLNGNYSINIMVDPHGSEPPTPKATASASDSRYEGVSNVDLSLSWFLLLVTVSLGAITSNHHHPWLPLSGSDCHHSDGLPTHFGGNH